MLAIEEMTDYPARRDHDGRHDFRRHRAERHPAALPHHGRPARVDVAAGEEFEAKILGLEPFEPGVKLEVTGGMNRPPFEKSAAIDVLFRTRRRSRAASASTCSTPT